MCKVEYSVNDPMSVEDFRQLLKSSTLSERRPIEDLACLRSMVENANLTVTARAAGELIGLARSVTDFSYCCYLSDLAVSQSFQRRGIGKELILRTKEQLGPCCKIILLSAPDATGYYSQLGFHRHPQAWVLAVPPGNPIRNTES